MRSGGPTPTKLHQWLIERLRRRSAPIASTLVFVALGLSYVFRWGSVVRHTPSLWITPPDLSDVYRASSALAHGHFNAIYQSNSGFLALPGFLIVLAPLGALSNVFHTAFVEITMNHHLLTHPRYLLSHTTHIWDSGTITSGANRANVYSVQPQWFVYVAPYVMALSCSVLFACDALAERLQVTQARRVVLGLAEAALLWPVVVMWGHPEDALAVALLVYCLWCALDDRFGWAGWLFGAAVAMQPLVILVFPIVLVLGGRTRVLGLILRGVVPSAVVVVGPLAAAFHATVHDIVSQPALPDLKGNHQTPWTFLAPKLGGKGASTTVGGGPTRAIALVAAAALGWGAIRWRERPEMLVWAAAVALALRSYTESVMTDYYVWPALAVGLIVAARGNRLRFGASIALAAAVTVVAQWRLELMQWWLIDVGGVTAVLVAAAWPARVERVDQPARTSVTAMSRAGTGRARTKKANAAKRKKARVDRKRSARR